MALPKMDKNAGAELMEVFCGECVNYKVDDNADIVCEHYASKKDYQCEHFKGNAAFIENERKKAELRKILEAV